MERYNITGMSCAACAARVEKAVNAVEGVESCAVSLLTNSMGVDGTASPKNIIRAVEAAGYGASCCSDAKVANLPEDDYEPLKDTETPALKKRLLTSLVFLLILMYFSMGHTMWGWRIPQAIENSCTLQGIIQLVLTMVVMLINRRFFTSGFKAVLNKAPNMDTLVALGSGAAFVYSLYGLVMVIINETSGNIGTAKAFMGDLYFESSAMILALITVGKTLEAYSKGKTTDALKSLMKITPKTAVIIVDGCERTVPVSEVKIGDVFSVRAGGNIPVDGVIIEGSAAIDESVLTGESIPVDKSIGDSVSAATADMSGYICCRATAVGEDTTISQIIRLVSDAAATKAPISRTADSIAAIFVPTVMAISLITVCIWLILGREAGYAIARGISVLVISCPCALGLATPVAIMVANGVGARHGILYKSAAAMEETGRISTIVFDKTGTITKGSPRVTDVVPVETVSQEELLSLAYTIEMRSEHPLAKAIVSYSEENNCAAESNVENFEELPGNGLSARINGGIVRAGNYRFISEHCMPEEKYLELINDISYKGKTPVFFCADNEFLGCIAISDTIKKDSRKAIKALKDIGIHVIMLTGDNEKTANAVADSVGINEVIAGVLPNKKAEIVKSLHKNNKTAMVGDGINDAPALMSADVGIAIGAGTDIAVDSADIVLVKGSPLDAANAIALSRKTLKNIKENLFWAFFYNAIGIPIAAGALSGIGITLNPMICAACMSLSSFCVVSNALRLNLVKLMDTEDDTPGIRRRHSNVKETKMMEKVFNVEGMMCPHCEARVVKAVEAIPGVKKVTASHENNTATVICAGNVSDEAIIDAIEKQDYKVVK